MESPSPTRVFETWLRQPRWVQTLVSVVATLIVIGLAVMIAIPALIIGACVVGAFFLAVGIRALILRLKEGPRTDSMRENVRIVVRRD